MTYKLLDLFCKAGGASMGYHRAGFEVTGVDIEPQPRYPFKFVQADALAYVAQYGWMYDAIVASPPCEGFSQITPKRYRNNHDNLIPATRFWLEVLGLPYVIENVGGARKQLHSPFMLCGTMFGLRVWRHRYFETNMTHNWLLPPCNHSFQPIVVNNSSVQKIATKSEASFGMGIDWMNRDELSHAIPPAYTEWIGKHLIAHLDSMKVESSPVFSLVEYAA